MVLHNQNANNNQVRKTMHNEGLLIMNKPQMHQDSYFGCTIAHSKGDGDETHTLTTILKNITI